MVSQADKISKLSVLLTMAFCSQLLAGYPRSADEFFVMARDRWAPVELQAMGVIGTVYNQAQANERLRQGCLPRRR